MDRSSYLSHDVSLTASVTVLLPIARLPSVSSVVCRLAGRVTDRQAALEVHRQLRKALCDTTIIFETTKHTTIPERNSWTLSALDCDVAPKKCL